MKKALSSLRHEISANQIEDIRGMPSSGLLKIWGCESSRTVVVGPPALLHGAAPCNCMSCDSKRWERVPEIIKTQSLSGAESGKLGVQREKWVARNILEAQRRERTTRTSSSPAQQYLFADEHAKIGMQASKKTTDRDFMPIYVPSRPTAFVAHAARGLSE
jgi:hypothetical protein